jgi:hypothetical protein
MPVHAELPLDVREALIAALAAALVEDVRAERRTAYANKEGRHDEGETHSAIEAEGTASR